MRYRLLGRTGLRVSEIGLGTWPLSGNSYGLTDDAESARLIEKAHAEGVNFFDTADIYGFGKSEELLGKALAGKEAVIATKAGWEYSNDKYRKRFDAEWVGFACRESLRRLGREYIDIYQLHNPAPEDLQREDLFAPLERLKQQGLIRFYGCSIHEPEEGLLLARHGKADVLQVILNLVDQRAARELLVKAEEKGIGIIAREPFGCGLLTGKYDARVRFTGADHRKRWKRAKIESDLLKLEKVRELFARRGWSPRYSLPVLALLFTLGHSAVSTVIPGAKTLTQLEANLAAAGAEPLPAALLEDIHRLYEDKEFISGGFFKN